MIKNFKKLLVVTLALGAFFVGGQAFAAGSVSDLDIPNVVAKVNGVAVNSEYVKFRLNLDLKSIPKELTTAEVKSLALEIIDKEIVRELIYQEGKSSGQPVSPEALQKELEKFKKAYENPGEYEEALKLRNITEEDLKKTIEVDILARNLMDRQVKGKVQISDSEVKEFFEAQKDRFHRPEAYRAQHIFIPFVPLDVVKNSSEQELSAKLGEYRTAAEKKIREVEVKVKSGEDFAALARTYSQDAGSASNGGDLDFIYLGVFDPAFDEAVAKLKIGEVSEVVASRFGYHIIKLNERKPPEDVPFEQVKEEVQKYLFMQKAQKLVQNYVEGLRSKAQIEYYYGAR